MTQRETIAANLRRAQVETGKTQSGIARAMRARGFSVWRQTTASRALRGDRPIHLDEGFALAEIFGIEVPHLFGKNHFPEVADPTAEDLVAIIQDAANRLARMEGE